MSNFLKWALALVGAASGLIKGYIFYANQKYDQLFFLACISAWVSWIVIAIIKNQDLPGPFAYKDGRNQVARIGYGILVIGLFMFYVLGK